ncbi:alpha-helical ferredoxin [Lucifera butyrica]|uniref:succinate dehydrogenase n=1 Tax=Lucifera butyrica TaxID=1351585 RepID=A0A498R2J0_9FIRM|nr:succinate dehydrogenase/fumarate reductase iron-sulfur subunit [Lucifera butyrica]VBB05365.1 alpha-helical ferredoxin [Lucifera butyrica]
MNRITYRIQRFDGSKRFLQEYTFDHRPGKTILWGLLEIKEKLDPTLTFTASCRSAVCGACAVRVNGQAVLACETPLDTMLDRFQTDTLYLEPLQNFKVIRDLVIDWQPKTERLTEVKPWLIPRDEFSATEGCRQSDAAFKEINTQAGCILCGACVSECSKLTAGQTDFYEPFIYSRAQKFVADSRDKAPLEHLRPAYKHGLWKCMHCVECVTKCPKKVAPGQDIAKLRQESIRRGMINNPGARHALAFLDDIAASGRLNEPKLALKTEGLLKSITRLPFALRLLRRGKLNPLHAFPAKIKGIEEVRAILRAVKEEQKQ